MQKTLTVDNIDYVLFKTATNQNVEDFIIDSRTYNDGLDFFCGCDFVTAYAYLVEKNNSPKFINEIEDFISRCEGFNVAPNKGYGYLESINDFSFLYKSVDNSEYDFFVTNFNLNMCGGGFYELLLKDHEDFVSRLEALSAFAIYAGADSSNDQSIFDFSLSYLVKKHGKIVKQIYADFIDELPYYKEEIDFKEFETVKNTKDKDIILKFIKTYFGNLPSSIQDEGNFYGLINKCVNKII